MRCGVAYPVILPLLPLGLEGLSIVRVEDGLVLGSARAADERDERFLLLLLPTDLARPTLALQRLDGC